MSVSAVALTKLETQTHVCVQDVCFLLPVRSGMSRNNEGKHTHTPWWHHSHAGALLADTPTYTHTETHAHAQTHWNVFVLSTKSNRCETLVRRSNLNLEFMACPALILLQCFSLFEVDSVWVSERSLSCKNEHTHTPRPVVTTTSGLPPFSVLRTRLFFFCGWNTGGN